MYKSPNAEIPSGHVSTNSLSSSDDESLVMCSSLEVLLLAVVDTNVVWVVPLWRGSNTQNILTRKDNTFYTHI